MINIISIVVVDAAVVVWCAIQLGTLHFVCVQEDGLCWEEGNADNKYACDETKERMWRVSGNRKIVRSDDPWQLGLQQAVAMWAERTDPGIRGSSSDAIATLCLRCSTQTWTSRGRVFICHGGLYHACSR